MPSSASCTKTGNRSGAKTAGFWVANQPSTCRSGRISRARSGSSSPIHAPAASDELTCFVGVSGRSNAHVVAAGLPRHDRLVLVNDRTRPPCAGRMREEAALGQEETAVGLKHRRRLIVDAPRRKAPTEVGAARGPRAARRARCTSERAPRTRRLPAHRRRARRSRAAEARRSGDSRARQRSNARRSSGTYERVLEVREADDPRQAVRGSAIVGQTEPLEHQHPASARGQMVRRGGPHAAGADDDDVGDHAVSRSRII